MAYKIKVRSTARKEFEHLCHTYQLTEPLNAWRNEIVHAVGSGSASQILDINLETAIDYLLAKFKAASWVERIMAVKALFEKRRPPWEQKLSIRQFNALGMAKGIEVHAYFEVDHANEVVVFNMFDFYSADDQCDEDSVDCTD